MNFIQLKIKYLIVLSTILVLFLGLFLINNHYNNTLITNSTSSYENLLLNITQNDLKEKIYKKESFFVYIGRPTCPDCKAFMPELKSILEKTNKSIFYYNTEAPASQKQEVRDYLKTLNINSVPSILLFNQGNIEQIFDCQYENQVQDFTKKFKEN